MEAMFFETGKRPQRPVPMLIVNVVGIHRIGDLRFVEGINLLVQISLSLYRQIIKEKNNQRKEAVILNPFQHSGYCACSNWPLNHWVFYKVSMGLTQQDTSYSIAVHPHFSFDYSNDAAMP